jgi:hypothetical protein
MTNRLLVSIPVILGFYHRVPIAPTTARIEDGNEVKVLQIGTTVTHLQQPKRE